MDRRMRGDALGKKNKADEMLGGGGGSATETWGAAGRALE